MGNLAFICEQTVPEDPDTPAAEGRGAEVDQSLPVHADLIFTGGTIITMDDSNPTVEALAVQGEKIVALGTKDDIFKLKGLFTRVVELTGTETLMPGLIEPHTHPSAVIGLSIFTDLSGFRYNSFAEVKKVIKDAVHKTKPADPFFPWVLFKGWDPALILDLPPLKDAKALDSLATSEYPVLLLNQALHSAWLNTKGLEVCGINRGTQDPNGGVIVRDKDGNPTGMLKEPPAIDLVLDKLPKPRIPELPKFLPVLCNGLRQYSKKGFTTITDMGTTPLNEKTLPLLSLITHLPECPVRMGLYYTPKYDKPSSLYTNKKLWFPGVKVWADGSPYAGSMAVAEPYKRSHMTEKGLEFDFTNFPCGYLIYCDDKTEKDGKCHSDAATKQAKVIQRFHDELIATHCHGERAIEVTLDAYEQLIRKHPENSDHRYRLDHTCLITEDQLQRATQLGVTVTMFVNHIYYYGAALRDHIIGQDRAERLAPTHLATKSGQKHWTIHQDSPCNPITPFLSMQTCVTRRMWKDPEHQLGPQYASTIDEALKAYTINAAWQLKREKELGSLEVGKLADLVVLSANPKLVHPEKLHNTIQVLETYVGGERFNHRKSSGTV